MTRSLRGYSRMQHRITHAILNAADEHEMPLTVRHVEIIAAASVRAAAVDLTQDHPRKALPLCVSSQQLRILVGVANGLTTLQVAHRLAIHEDTVKTHLRRLYQALGVTGRPQAIAVALKLNLIGLDDIDLPTAAEREAAA